MVQKVIKIGSSLGVTIPKKELEGLGIGAGDEVQVTIKPVGPKPSRHDMDVYELTQKLIARHKQALKNLANR